MLTHAQATQVKLAFAARARPEDIAKSLGVDLADVIAVLQRRAPKHATILPLSQKRPDRRMIAQPGMKRRIGLGIAKKG